MQVEMDRYWLLTSTTYGTWLPGDNRGFVSNVRDGDGPEVRHNIPHTAYDADMPGLERSARCALMCDPIRFVRAQAEVLLNQFQETAQYRQRQLLAVGIMTSHIHLVVGTPGDPDPSTLLADFKSYGSRALNKSWSKPVSETWWTDSGSKRKLSNQSAVLAAIQYVVEQEFPLVIWTAPIPELNLPGGRLRTSVP
jgi:REP element-mobilizing transposase RayT